VPLLEISVSLGVKDVICSVLLLQDLVFMGMAGLILLAGWEL
jgi:hypothetical protein